MMMILSSWFRCRPLGRAGKLSLLSLFAVGGGFAQDAPAVLRERVAQLERELAAARAELAEAEAAPSHGAATPAEASAQPPVASPRPSATWRIGGAMRINYTLGDYPKNPAGAPSRGGDGGNVGLDIFRVNIDGSWGENWTAKGEYRWLDGYNFLHTAWLGYTPRSGEQYQLGVNRVPFGAGPYGVSQSWFFDQHYYVGLADDMDLGFKVLREVEDWRFAAGFYLQDEGSWNGASRDSARYSYDLVDETGAGFVERGQFNVRAIRAFVGEGWSTDLGFSLQYLSVENRGPGANGDQVAAALHGVTEWRNWMLGSQLSYYSYGGMGEQVLMGAYDFPTLVAAEAWLPAVSLSYLHETTGLPWLDSVRPYIEYSSIMKSTPGFNDSALAVWGVAFASGGWYVYAEWARSNGNDFVGGDAPFGDRFGANSAAIWQNRFNINFGFYY